MYVFLMFVYVFFWSIQILLKCKFKKNSFIQSLHNIHVVFTYWVCKHKHVKVHVKTWKIRNQCIYSTTMSGMVLAYFLLIYQLCIALGFKDCEPQQEISGSKLHVPDIQRKNAPGMQSSTCQPNNWRVR